MADTGLPGRVSGVEEAREVFHPPGFFSDLEPAVFPNREPRGVVTAIFQTLQPFDENGPDVQFSGVTENTTHKEEMELLKSRLRLFVRAKAISPFEFSVSLSD
jgi:hypothetical protein